MNRFLQVVTVTGAQAPQKEGKKRTTMGTALMSILLTGLLMLFVLTLLVVLVASLARLMNDAGTRDDDKTGAQSQQRFLQSSVLHIINRAGR